jgi:hypothetical protein
MNKLFSLACVAALTAACTTTDSPVTGSGIRFSGWNGESMQQAVVILGAQGENDGIAAEHQWVKEKLPGWSFSDQELVTNTKAFDVITLRSSDGSERRVYFDISKFFGKF